MKIELSVNVSFKGLYETGFDVLSNHHIVGCLCLKGKLGRQDGSWELHYREKNRSMRPVQGKGQKRYRPFEITPREEGEQTGQIFQTYRKAGFL